MNSHCSVLKFIPVSSPPYTVSLPILGGTPILPPNFAKNGQSPYFFIDFFFIFLLNHIQFSNISHMEIIITFEACAALLKKSIENGDFRAFSRMKFSKVDTYENCHANLPA